MNSRKHLHAALFALVPLCSLTLAAAPVQAQQYSRDANVGPVISGFNVDEVRRIRPGAELDFDLYGTPGGVAVLRIDGARRNLHLTETEPGRYEGTYTIGSHDRIAANSAVTANLRVGNRVTTGVLSESLLRGYGRHGAPGRGDLAAVPRVERFGVQGNQDLDPGSDLTFNLRGTPNAKVDVTIAGSRGVFFLPEVRPGEYSGVYTIRRHDHIAPNSAVTATIRANGRYSTATLGEPLLASMPQSTPRMARYCSNCATVQAVNVVEVSGDGSYLGTVGGALVGGLLGSQVGSGNGRTAAEVAGAVGGAVAGRNIEQQNSRHHQRYEVVVRYANGAVQTLPYDNDPGFRTGDKVRVNNGILARDN
jgi:outer membrane lipoprotein SlyB